MPVAAVRPTTNSPEWLVFRIRPRCPHQPLEFSFLQHKIFGLLHRQAVNGILRWRSVLGVPSDGEEQGFVSILADAAKRKVPKVPHKQWRNACEIGEFIRQGVQRITTIKALFGHYPIRLFTGDSRANAGIQPVRRAYWSECRWRRGRWRLARKLEYRRRRNDRRRYPPSHLLQGR